MGFMLGRGFDIDNRQDLVFTLLWMAVSFVSILVHELGHALVSKKLTRITPSIKLWAMGGLADSRTHLTREHKLKVVWAGPLAGLALFLVVLLMCCLIYGIEPGARIIGWLIYRPNIDILNMEALSILREMNKGVFQLLWALVFVNFWWSLVNLLPVFPLDGGQIYACLESSERKVSQVGLITGAVCAAIGLMAFQSIFIGILFGYLAYQNYQRLQQTSGGYR
jgi:stage IV sporulation protein FB